MAIESKPSAEKTMRQFVTDLANAYASRETELRSRSIQNLRDLANNREQTFDLNKTQLVKYILTKEFPTR